MTAELELADWRRRVAALYLDSADPVPDVPAGLLESTGGVPRRLHQAVASWAEELATRQLGVLASQAAGSRSETAVVETQLASKVTNLQQVRERAPRMTLWLRDLPVPVDVAPLLHVQRAGVRTVHARDNTRPRLGFDQVEQPQAAPLVVAVWLTQSHLTEG